MAKKTERNIKKLTVPAASLPGGGLAPAETLTTGAQVLAFAAAKGVAQVDLKFVDLPGQWHHFSVPISMMGEDEFADGIGFDGSSIRGFQFIHESDMLLIPDPSTAWIDPFNAVPTLSLICDVKDPITGQMYPKDPRGIAKRGVEYLKSTGIADVCYFGPEAEFFVFDSVRFDQNQHSGYYFINSDEGIWESGRENEPSKPNLGHRPRYKEGYFPVPPLDTLQGIRTEMMLTLIAMGIDVETHHHEVATGGQCEIDMRFAPLVKMADNLLIYKYVVHNVAKKYGKTATFMPKPLFNDNGSGMHCHQSLWKGGQPLFFKQGTYANLSDIARWYIGGILKHGSALMAFCGSTVNSYRRLVPGFEAPVNLVYSQRNRSAACRIPTYSQSPKSKRVEFRCPDPLSNPYLAFTAQMMAGLDGIQNKIEPGDPYDVDLFELPAEELAKVRTVPDNLGGSLQALLDDHDFLLEGDVFTKEYIEGYVEYKRHREIDPVRLRPHPYEFYLYYEL